MCVIIIISIIIIVKVDMSQIFSQYQVLKVGKYIDIHFHSESLSKIKFIPVLSEQQNI